MGSPLKLLAHLVEQRKLSDADMARMRELLEGPGRRRSASSAGGRTPPARGGGASAMTTAHLLLRVVHISMGLVALGAGASAMLLRKGGHAHMRAGTVFFGAMLVMIGCGLAIAKFIRPSAGSVLGGMLTLYFTVTGWATMRAAPGHVGRLPDRRGVARPRDGAAGVRVRGASCVQRERKARWILASGSI